ncbi:hypothetical protein VNI00_013596 [Paramarasmius palmivorus]|uniref:Uncharacterized protein n=1 Tax=Paramarasmius palmivorus TaxID=297713 RepID=A0AAW0BYA9_9AGAR
MTRLSSDKTLTDVNEESNDSTLHELNALDGPISESNDNLMTPTELYLLFWDSLRLSAAPVWDSEPRSDAPDRVLDTVLDLALPSHSGVIVDSENPILEDGHGQPEGEDTPFMVDETHPTTSTQMIIRRQSITVAPASNTRSISTETETATANHRPPNDSSHYQRDAIANGHRWETDPPPVYSERWYSGHSDTASSPVSPNIPESPIATTLNNGRASYHNKYDYYDIPDNCGNTLRELLEHPDADLHIEQEPTWDYYLTAGPTDGDSPHLGQNEDSILHSTAFQHWKLSDEDIHCALLCGTVAGDSVERLNVDNVYQRHEYPAPPRIVTKVEETNDWPISGDWTRTNALPDLKGSNEPVDDTALPAVAMGPIEPTRIHPVGSHALSDASMRRRERIASYSCILCFATFTAKHNLKSECS